MKEIPCVIEQLYFSWVMPPDPKQWPDYLRGDTVRGYGLYAFYQGLQLGMELSAACREQ